MNTKAQAIFVGLMIGIASFMFAMIVIDPMSDVITEARSSTQLDCTNSSISDGHKMTCLAVDISLPLMIGVFIGLAGAFITRFM